MKDARSQSSAAKVVRLRTQAEIARDREDAARDVRLAKYGITSAEIRETLMHPPKERKRKRAAAIEMPAFVFHGPVTIVIEAKKR
jgi:hypothetical protein